MWYSWYEPYIGLDMYPILKKRNYSLIGGDAKIAPKETSSMYEVGNIPKPKPIVITPHQGGVIWTLWEDSMIFFAFMESGFLIIFPALKYLSMFITWMVPMTPRCFTVAVKVTKFIGKWAMLDVFVLGTQLFIHEAGQYITMKALPGLKWMWILLFVSYTLDIFWAMGVSSCIDSVK
jgi:hypothetical protein